MARRRLTCGSLAGTSTPFCWACDIMAVYCWADCSSMAFSGAVKCCASASLALERFDGDPVLHHLVLFALLRRRALHGGAQGQQDRALP
jgi:hypothetical protein